MKESEENETQLTPAEEMRIQIEKSKEAGDDKFLPPNPDNEPETDK